jgi:hypothetical protein
VTAEKPSDNVLCVVFNRMEKKTYEKGLKSSMNQKKIILLESIGFVWAKEKGNIAWENSFEELKAYKKEHGHSKCGSLFVSAFFFL